MKATPLEADQIFVNRSPRQRMSKSESVAVMCIRVDDLLANGEGQVALDGLAVALQGPFQGDVVERLAQDCGLLQERTHRRCKAPETEADVVAHRLWQPELSGQLPLPRHIHLRNTARVERRLQHLLHHER